MLRNSITPRYCRCCIPTVLQVLYANGTALCALRRAQAHVPHTSPEGRPSKLGRAINSVSLDWCVFELLSDGATGIVPFKCAKYIPVVHCY